MMSTKVIPNNAKIFYTDFTRNIFWVLGFNVGILIFNLVMPHASFFKIFLKRVIVEK